MAGWRHRARPEPECARHVARPGRAVEVKLGCGVPTALEEVGPDRETQVRTGDARDERGLVIAPIPNAIPGRGHRHQDIPARTGPCPTPGHGKAQWLRDPSITRVLQPVEGPTGDAREVRAPLHLGEGRRDVPG